MTKRIDIGHWVIAKSVFGGHVLTGIRRGTGEHIKCAVFAVYGCGSHTRWGEVEFASTDLGRSVRLLGPGKWVME